MLLKKLSYLLLVVVLIGLVGCKKSDAIGLNTDYDLLGTWELSLTFENGEKQSFEYFTQNSGFTGAIWHDIFGNIGVFTIMPNGEITLGVVYLTDNMEIHQQNYVGSFKSSSLIEGTFIYELEDSYDITTVRKGTFIGTKK